LVGHRGGTVSVRLACLGNDWVANEIANFRIPSARTISRHQAHTLEAATI
jgi:hypothetical protein